MNKTKCIIFDIGNILIYDFPIEAQYLHNVYLSSRNVLGNKSFCDFLELKEKYKCDYNKWVYIWGKEHFKEHWASVDNVAWQKVLSDWKRHCIFVPDVIDELMQHRNDYMFAICANQPKEMHTVLKEKRVTQLFNSIIFDSDCGYSKPDLRIFKKILKIVNLNPEECLMVGDKYIVDIVPASRLGLQTALILNNYNDMKKLSKTKWEYEYIEYMERFEEKKAETTFVSIKELFKELENTNN